MPRARVPLGVGRIENEGQQSQKLQQHQHHSYFTECSTVTTTPCTNSRHTDAELWEEPDLPRSVAFRPLMGSTRWC